MAIEQIKTVTVEKTEDVEVTHSAITVMTVNLKDSKIDLKVQPGNLDETTGEFMKVGDPETFTVANEKETTQSVNENLTLDASLQVQTSLAIKANLVVKHGDTLLFEGTDYSRPDAQTIEFFNLAAGEIVSVSYNGTKPATTDFDDVIYHPVSVDHELAGNFQTIIWNKLIEQGKVSGPIVASGPLL